MTWEYQSFVTPAAILSPAITGLMVWARKRIGRLFWTARGTRWRRISSAPTNLLHGRARWAPNRCSDSTSAQLQPKTRPPWWNTATWPGEPSGASCGGRTDMSNHTTRSIGAWATRWTDRGRLG